jgi:hypothetical protein
MNQRVSCVLEGRKIVSDALKSAVCYSALLTAISALSLTVPRAVAQSARQ